MVEEEIRVLKRDAAILMTEHNIPHDFLELHYDCNKCNDTGFLSNGKQCHCYKQALIKLSYKHSNITEGVFVGYIIDVIQRMRFTNKLKDRQSALKWIKANLT